MIQKSSALLGGKTIPEPDKNSDKGDGDSENSGTESPDPDEGETASSARKARPSGSAKKARPSVSAMKARPSGSAKKASAQPAPKDPAKLKFPGIKMGNPIHYGQSTVYLDLVNKQWRIKSQPGERVMINRSFKSESPNKVWPKVVLELKRLNP
jgi:hypothetical protein